MVKRVLELVERLDNETKQLMYKKKQLCLAKQKYDEVTENEQGLSYKYAVASKQYIDLVSKNDRRLPVCIFSVFYFFLFLFITLILS